MNQRVSIDIPSQVFPHGVVTSLENSNWGNIASEYAVLKPYIKAPEVTFNHLMVAVTHAGKVKTTCFSDGLSAEHHILRGGGVSIYPAGISAHWQVQADTTYQVIRLPLATINQVMLEACDLSALTLPPLFNLSDSFIKSIFHRLLIEMDPPGTLGQLYVDALLNSLIVHLFKCYSTAQQTISQPQGGLTSYQLRMAIDYIHNHLRENIKLVDIANCLNLSSYYFCRLFKQSMGLSPHQYVLKQRIKKAKVLLKQSQMPITDIALACGFANQSHFSRRFRMQMGISPKAYRTQM